MKATDSSNCKNDFDYNLFDPSSLQNATLSTTSNLLNVSDSDSDLNVCSEEKDNSEQYLINDEKKNNIRNLFKYIFCGIFG